MDAKHTRLSRDDVERQISEMWDALADTPMWLRDDGYDQAIKKAYQSEADLRKRLDDQDKLDAAAPDLLKALKLAEDFVSAIVDMTEDRGRINEKSISKPGVTIKRHARQVLPGIRAAIAKAQEPHP